MHQLLIHIIEPSLTKKHLYYSLKYAQHLHIKNTHPAWQNIFDNVLLEFKTDWKHIHVITAAAPFLFGLDLSIVPSQLATLVTNLKGIVRFCRSGNRLSVGQMCCDLSTKARMWPIRLQSIHSCCQIISYPFRGLGKVVPKNGNSG